MDIMVVVVGRKTDSYNSRIGKSIKCDKCACTTSRVWRKKKFWQEMYEVVRKIQWTEDALIGSKKGEYERYMEGMSLGREMRLKKKFFTLHHHMRLQ